MVKKILVIIPTFNNEKHIINTLRSIPGDFETAIIDSGSNDDTVKICRQFTNYIIDRKVKPWNAGDQRNFALRQFAGKFDCFFYLDSDEEITSELANELRTFANNHPNMYGSVRSIYHLFGRPLYSISSNTYHDRVLSNIKNLDIFTDSPGEVFKTKRSEIIKFKFGYTHHIDSKGWINWVTRIFFYSFQNGAIDAKHIKNGVKRESKNFGTVRRYRIIFLFSLPIFYFLYYLFIRKCFKDGISGVIFSLVMSAAYITYPFGFLSGLIRNE